MQKIWKLALTDFKLIFRDPSLRTFLVLPVILFVLIIWILPGLVQRYDFLEPYLPVFLVIAVIENTQLFCFINSMVLIDEKETEVAKAYGIVPLSNLEYILSRFLFPYLFTVLLNVVLLLVQPFYDIGLGENLLLASLTALIVPVYALAINSIVQNRMQGMVWVKAFNMIVLIPIAAFFVPGSFKHFFGILPTHWIFQSVEQITAGRSIGLTLGGAFYFSQVCCGSRPDCLSGSTLCRDRIGCWDLGRFGFIDSSNVPNSIVQTSQYPKLSKHPNIQTSQYPKIPNQHFGRYLHSGFMFSTENGEPQCRSQRQQIPPE
ncbi:MAG: hypothetical protein R2824_27360 [Saprospiraceae bacterium]